MQSLIATEAVMNLIMIAYNLFRQVVVCRKVQPDYEKFAVGGYITGIYTF
ncbi:MAG TPA: hypothetical protein HPP56_01360 [Nitrospirae bacterium]|nr:hypothetical protein [Nitrospirota bacterium]